MHFSPSLSYDQLVCPLSVQYMFQTCVNTDSQRTLHDELAKQLALYLKQQDSSSISLLLDVSGGQGWGWGGSFHLMSQHNVCPWYSILMS